MKKPAPRRAGRRRGKLEMRGTRSPKPELTVLTELTELTEKREAGYERDKESKTSREEIKLSSEKKMKKIKKMKNTKKMRGTRSPKPPERRRQMARNANFCQDLQMNRLKINCNGVFYM